MNNNTALAASLAAVQYYTEQVRQEMREQQPESMQSNFTASSASSAMQTIQAKEEANELQSVKEDVNTLGATAASVNINSVSSSLVNLHLGCINEDIDAGNEADTEGDQSDLNRTNKSTTVTLNNNNDGKIKK